LIPTSWGRLPVKHEAQLRNALQIDSIGESTAQKRCGPSESSAHFADIRAIGLVSQHDGEVDSRMSVIDGQDDARDPDRLEARISHLVAKKSDELPSNELL